MGMATLREFLPRADRFRIKILARPGRRNRKKLKPFTSNPAFSVIWGDLCDYDDVAEGVRDADYVLHIGGLVSPQADYNPRLTMRVNVTAAANVARAVSARPDSDEVKVVYIGSVAQVGDRRPPYHWGRTGDPLMPSKFDAYALSKIEAERAIADAGLKHWVCIRQTGILCPELLMKGTDPIAFHVPLAGVLEWTTAEDSGRLMANICDAELPESFWNRFYNIGSGESYRLTNYEFESELLKALRCPPPEKVFGSHWFALKNFHGQFWADSDRLEALVPYRSGMTCREYFDSMRRRMPWYFSLAPVVPAALISWFMRKVAMKPMGTLRYIADDDKAHIEAMFGSREEWEKIPGWDKMSEMLAHAVPEAPGSRMPKGAELLPHGYDESKPESELSIEDMREKAAFHGGECLSASMVKGDMGGLLKWKCAGGHTFHASPALVLLGGHWCPQCTAARVGVDRYKPV